MDNKSALLIFGAGIAVGSVLSRMISLYCVKKRDHREVVAELKEYGAKVYAETIQTNSRNRRTPVVAMLLARNAEV